MARALIVAAIVTVLVGWAAIGTAQTPTSPPAFRFTYRPLDVGDEAQEATHFVLDLKTVRLHDGQVVDIADQVIERDEESHVVRLPPGSGQSAKAKVTYQASRQTAKGRRGVAAAESDRPVAGKTYFVARKGEDLQIVDEQGASPPNDEHEIVARAMDGLGRKSPLGTFLNGRTVKIGDTIRLPAEFTHKMLAGWDESLAALPLDVIFMGTQHVDGQRCALLHTPPASTAKPGTERAPVEGKLLIEFDTCRLAVMELRGPVAATERQGQPGEEFDVRRKGKLQVAVHVEHHRAAR
ncbi:MAG TPA: hypothetical protein VGG64_17670 [Pirellulales bacterium]|jgi:hypothetical protein